MPISSTLNELSKLALLACDESYFTPARPISNNSPLNPFPDTPKYDILPRFMFQQGFFKEAQFEVQDLGFKAIAFRNQAVINGPAEYILAFGGTDGPDPVDWTSNTQLGWNQWNDTRVKSQILNFLNSLGPNDKVTFTGQSLGGALAQYAAYEYIRLKTVNFPGNADFDPAFDKPRVSLITFNGLGGVQALTANLPQVTPYDPTLLNNIGAVAHFYVTNDLVARLGGGHVGGAEYRLDYKADAINPNTGNPYLLDFVNAHRIETGFYDKMEPGVEFLNATAEAVAPLNIDSAREYAALFGNLLNDKDLGPEESKFRFAAAVLAGTTFGSPASINTIMQTYLTAERDAGNIGDFWGGILTKINWGAASVLIRPVTGALTPVTLFGAVMADALGAVGTGVQSLFSSLASYFSLVFPGAGPVQPPLESTMMRQLQLEMMLAAAPGALPGNERLTTLIQPLGLNLDQYAQHLLSGTNWFGQTVAYLREQAEANAAPGQEALQANLFLAQLGSAVASLAQELPGISQTELAAITNELNFLVADTAKGTGNAFTELIAKATDAIFSVGQALNFSQLSLVSEAYAAELKDPRLSSAIRPAIETALSTLERAGQTVVISKGVGVNPFNGQGFDPDAVPPATVSVSEGQWQALSIYLPFAADTGGQHLTLSLNGPGASSFVLRTTDGELTQQNGGFSLVVPEGERYLMVELRAKDDVSSTSNLSLSVELTTPDGDPTHEEKVEASITLTDTGKLLNGDLPVINYFNGQQTVTWVGDNDNNEPIFNAGANHVVFGNGGYDVLNLSLSVAMFNHQIFGGMGNDELNGGEGKDRLYGEEGFDFLSGGGGDDVLYGGDTSDRLLGDSIFYVFSVPGDDYLDGGAGDDLVEGQAGNDTLYGGEGSDFLLGDDCQFYANRPAGNDYLDGGIGNDYLFGGRGDDTLLGGAGDDLLRGDDKHNSDPDLLFNRVPGSMTFSPTTVSAFIGEVAGNDYLDGGAGDDTLMGDGGDDVLLGGAGNDHIYGDQEPQSIFGVTDGRDWLEGGAGNDFMVGGGEEDALFGGDGDDTLFGDYTNASGFADYLDGGAGNDFLVGVAGEDTLIGGEGNDRLEGQEDDDVILGGSGDDILTGDDGNDEADGGDGNDEVNGNSGDDLLAGGAGDDFLLGGIGDDVLDGEDGIDELQGGAGDDLLIGGIGNDFLLGDEGADILSGEDGDDRLQGGLGDDLIAGDNGNDRLYGQEGSDTLSGDIGDDQLVGGLENDVLDGGIGDDVLIGDDTATNTGPGGDDVLEGGIGNDFLYGGSGVDTYLYNSGDGFDVIGEGNGEGNRLVFGSGIDFHSVTLGVTALDSLVVRTGSGGDGIEILQFGTANLAGSHPIDTFEFADGTMLSYGQLASGGLAISGGALDDLLLGTAQGERLFGGGGNDTIQGQAGADSLLGEDGADLLEGGADNDVLSGGTGDDTLLGGTGDDRLVGGLGADVLRGEDGSDTLEGSAGTDTLEGGDGADVLNGGTDIDTLDGGAGDDTIIGGAGNDQLNGGDGSDTYRFSLGDGVDSVFDSGSSTDTDKVLFGAGIAVSSLRLVADSGQALVKVGAGPDGIYVGSTSDVLGSQTIEQFQFADGSLITYAQLIATGFDIDGTDFDDFLSGTNVVDRFRGGAGNDSLNGGAGDDSYFFNLGDGVDTLVDSASVGAGNEVVFGPGITSADLRLDLAPDQSDLSLSDLLLRVGNGGDAIQLDTFDRNNVLSPRTVESFRFADGSTLTYDQLLARGFDVTGSDGDDQIAGTNAVDRIVAGDGADVLRSGAGDDTLDGGLGNDRLLGGQGNDTYVFGPGSGQDTIIESQGSLDTIRMAPGVAPSDVVVTRDDRDLVLSLSGGADRLTVSLYFLGAPLQIERVQFADGTIWDQTVLENLTQPAITGTGGADVLVGTNGNNRLAGLAGDDQLAGLAGNDRLDGGTGVDQLTGGAGDDTYIMDDAGDVVTELVNEGSDTVLSAVSTQLSANVENLTLTGNAVSNGTGNALDNVLTGNSAANVLTGGAGNDIYVVGAGDTVVELAGEGTDTVEAGVNTTIGANVENLTLTGSASLIGTGNALDNVLQADGSISVLAGGDGNDTYLIGPNGDDDILVETATGGIDTVVAAHDYRLPDHIENLTLLDLHVPDFSNMRFDFGVYQNGPNDPFAVVPVRGIGNELDNTLIGGRANNLLDGGLGADTLVGGAGDDTYIVDHVGDVVSELANEGTDTIESSVTYDLSANVETLVLTGAASANGTGNALNNDIRGNEASNILDGGAGDDSLMGFGGADTYLFGRGAGRDNVFDAGTAGEIDTIQLASDVAPTDVEVYRRDFGLVLVISGTTNEITLASFFDQPAYAQKQVQFADGTVWNEAELRARALETGLIFGTAGNDTLTLPANARHRGLVGDAGNDSLTGGDWDDALYGDTTSFLGPQATGHDTLIGGKGDDLLFDLRGTNLFDGGVGNDTLVLGTGVDTVLFDRGAGNDSVTLDNNRNDIDIIQLAAGISPADVVMTRRSSALSNIVDLVILDSGDKVSIALSTDWFAVGSETTQAVVRFADGTAWSLAWASPDLPFTELPLGSSGDNTYSVGDGSGPIVELLGEGIDTVQSTVDYTLPANVENLFLADFVADNATGNELDNLIIGNTRDNILDGGAGSDVLVGGLFRQFEVGISETGSDILIGGEGDDIFMADGGDFTFGVGSGVTGGPENDVPRQADDLFIGGTGNDTYVVHSQQQTIAEFANEGTDTVKSTASYTLGEHLENLTLVSPPVRFDNDGNILPSAPLNGIGNELDNLLIGSGDDNVLSGLAGRDTLWGGNDVDPDSGSARSGNDTLIGGAGHDTYLFNLGDGVDTIQDVAAVGEGNRVQFGVGVARTDLTLTQDQAARTLTIQVGASGTDRLVLTNFDPTGSNGSLVVETLAFADGSAASLASFFGPAITEGDDTFTTGAGDDVINALGGNDVVDTGAGNDTITGGTGNDTLSGGAGNDTYIFNAGDGTDTINDTSLPGEGNTVQFGQGIDPAGLSLDLGSLLICVGTNGDTIHLTNFDPGNVLGPRTIENFRFADGPVLSYDQLVARGFDLTGTVGDDQITGTNVVDRISGLSGRDTIQAGAGNDLLNGGFGSDTYLFNLGDGIDTIQDVAAAGEGNRIQLGAGITQNNLIFTRDDAARTLTIQVGSSGTDKLFLTNFDPTGANGSLVVEMLAFADGSTLNLAELFTNHAPTVTTPLADQTVPEDAPFSFLVPSNTFVDQDAGDMLTLSASLADGMALPTWLSFDASTRAFSGTPDEAQVGSLDLSVTATDRENASVSEVFTLTVTNVNDAPTVANPIVDQSANTGDAFAFTMPTNTFADVDAGDQLTYSATLADGGALPAWLSFNSTTRTFSGTPGASNAGVVNLKVTATDTGNLSVADLFDLTVTTPNLVLTGTAGNDVLTGGAGDDQLFGLAGNDSLQGGAGHDLLDGGTGADTMAGGSGNDTYVVESVFDVVTEAANEGVDMVQSALLTYTLGANVENLTLTGTGPSAGIGNALSNQLVGNSGANLLDGKGGADTMAGGAGDDLYIVDHVGDLVTEQANEGALDSVMSSVSYALSANVENLVLTGTAAINGTGNDLDNVLTGNSAVNVLTGLGGNDTYVIGAGDTVMEAANGGMDTVISGLTHTLSANVENLTLVGFSAISGTGNALDNVLNGLLNLAGNTLTGGAGNDIYILGSGDQVVEAANGGTDTVHSLATYTLGANLENLTLTGIGAVNGTGNSLNNTMTGNSANNTLSGANGNDTLRGGLGNDTVNGGSGNDTFLFGRGEGQDLIQDNSGTADKILYDAEINPLDLVISRQANDLRLTIHGTTDRVTIQNWYSAPTTAQIETIQAGNGQTMLSAQVDQLIQAMASFSQQTGLTWDQAIDQRPQDVQAVLAASWQ